MRNKKLIRMTEGDLRNMVRNAVNRILETKADLNEDVLGDHFRENDDDVMNNYEPFKHDASDEVHMDGYGDHDWSTVGEEGFDETEYDPDAFIDYDAHDPSDNELYHQ
jgi:hypothetical protein